MLLNLPFRASKDARMKLADSITMKFKWWYDQKKYKCHLILTIATISHTLEISALLSLLLTLNCPGEERCYLVKCSRKCPTR